MRMAHAVEAIYAAETACVATAKPELPCTNISQIHLSDWYLIHRIHSDIYSHLS